MRLDSFLKRHGSDGMYVYKTGEILPLHALSRNPFHEMVRMKMKLFETPFALNLHPMRKPLKRSSSFKY